MAIAVDSAGEDDDQEDMLTIYAEDEDLSSQKSRVLINPIQVAAMVSNFSTSYNVVNISLVLPILRDLYGGSSEDIAACASSLLAGMIVGQITGGALGDSFLGRLGALRLVMLLQIIASICSAMIWSEDIYFSLAIWRFILGIGAGAVYPLAAVLSVEQNDTEEEKELSAQEKVTQLRKVVLTFSMQGIGFLAVPVLALPLLYIIPDKKIGIVWRLLLGMGCLPGIALIVLQFFVYRGGVTPQPVEVAESNINENREDPLLPSGENDEVDDIADENGFPSSPGIWSSIRKEPKLFQKLLGTAATWLLFDVLFYGNTLFQPIVFEAAFGSKTSSDDDLIKKAAMDSLILGLIALPGYIISAIIIGKRICYIIQTPRYIQLQGFAAMAILYSIIGAYWSYLKQVPSLLVIIYGLTFFFANYGPNTTTFIFPSLVYSHDCRSSLNGISAAAGKAGALLGASLFAPATVSLGNDKVMLICAGISIVAFAFTAFFTRIPMTNESSTS